MEAERLMEGLQMLRDSGASEAEIDAYMSDWGITRAQLEEAQDWEDVEGILTGLAEDRERLATGSDAGYAFGNVNQTLGTLAGLPVDAATGVINTGIWGANQMGADVPYIEDPFLGAESITSKLDDWSTLGMRATNAAGITDTSVPERISQTQSATPMGEVVGGGLGELAAALTGVGAGGLLAKAGDKASDAVRWLAEVLTEQPAMQAATSFGAGAGMGAAREAGAEGLPGELAGAAAGGVGGYGIGKLGGLLNDYLVRPFTRGGQDVLAGQVIRGAAQQPVNETAAGIQSGAAMRETPGVQPTTPAVSGDVGMAALARGLMNAPETGMPQMWGQRAIDNDAAYRQHLGEVGVDVLPEAAGRTLRNTFDQQYTAMRGEVSRAYDAIDPDGTSAIPTDGIWETMADVTQRRFADRTAGTPQAVQDIMARFGPRATMTFNQLDTIQKELADLSASYRNQGQNNLAGAVDEMRTAVMGTIDGALPANARALRRTQGELYETGPATLFERDRFGQPETQNSAIPDSYLRSSYEGGLQFGQTLGQSPTARQQMADHMVKRATESATNQGSGQLQGLGLTRYFQRIDPFLRGLKDGGALSQEHYDTLQRVASELTQDQQALRRGMAIGSPTVQNLSIANLISRATGGAVPAGALGGVTLGAPERISSLLYRLPQREILSRVTQAMLDPDLAVMLLDKATPGNLQRFEQMFQRRYGTAMGLATLTTEEPIPATPNGQAAVPRVAAPAPQPAPPRAAIPAPPLPRPTPVPRQPGQSPVEVIGGGSWEGTGRR